jgi:2-amino-4-hydroxy-6-hydroxymethyldihydropteridine diphosphokinase
MFANREIVHLGLGTNVGDRDRNLRTALTQLRPIMDIDSISSVYETDPVGYADQPRFLNIVARARCSLSPAELLQELIAIEERMGRRRTFRNAPRIIDIDILLYGDVVLAQPGLDLPHPRLTERAFVLAPLVEISPELADPLTGKLYRDMLRDGKFETIDRVGALEL